MTMLGSKEHTRKIQEVGVKFFLSNVDMAGSSAYIENVVTRKYFPWRKASVVKDSPNMEIMLHVRSKGNSSLNNKEVVH